MSTNDKTRTISPDQGATGGAGKPRYEEYSLVGPEGKTVTIRRNIETGEQTVKGDAMQRGDRPGVGDEISLRVEKGEVGKDKFPPPMPEPVREPVSVTVEADGTTVSAVLPVSHEDVATPAEVKRRSRQKDA
jgi:hypothetical protein